MACYPRRVVVFDPLSAVARDLDFASQHDQMMQQIIASVGVPAELMSTPTGQNYTVAKQDVTPNIIHMPEAE